MVFFFLRGNKSNSFISAGGGMITPCKNKGLITLWLPLYTSVWSEVPELQGCSELFSECLSELFG